MRKGFVLLAVVCLVVGVVFGQSGWTKTEYGSYKIERFWEETVGQFTCTYTIVSYKNTSQTTFAKNVTFRIAVYDAKGNMIDTEPRSFFAFEYGPIKPGFEGTLKVAVSAAPGQAKSSSAKIESAQ
jgi:hypothetical protein